MTRMPAPISSQSGVSLVEMLVALAISLMLAAGILQVFQGSAATYSFARDHSRLQENGRLAMHILRDEVNGAGFLGCLQHVGSVTNTLKNSHSFTFRFTEGVYGLEAVGANSWLDHEGAVIPTATGTGPKNLALTLPAGGSDILVLRGIDPDFRARIESHNPSSAVIKVPDGTPGINTNENDEKKHDDILMITDCEHASIFQATGYASASGTIVHNAPGGCNPAYGGKTYPCNETTDLGHEYLPGSELYKPQTMVLYVRRDGEASSLYRKMDWNDVEDLVEGVENMQVLYGEDTNGDRRLDRYVNANAVGNWGNVVTLRIGLLMRTPGEIPKGELDTKRYDVDGDGRAEFDPPDDRRLRLVVSGTIGLRNRLR